jgi:hypothetical protein
MSTCKTCGGTGVVYDGREPCGSDNCTVCGPQPCLDCDGESPDITDPSDRQLASFYDSGPDYNEQQRKAREAK